MTRMTVTRALGRRQWQTAILATRSFIHLHIIAYMVQFCNMVQYGHTIAIESGHIIISIAIGYTITAVASHVMTVMIVAVCRTRGSRTRSRAYSVRFMCQICIINCSTITVAITSDPIIYTTIIAISSTLKG